MSSTQRVIVGFLCAALSVVIFHQGMILVLREIGMLPGATRVWNLAPTPWGVPTLLNQCFWGGLYGAVFGALAPRFTIPLWLAGLLTGVAAMLVGFFVVAMLKGNPIAGGWAGQAWLRSFLINGCFGLGLGLIWTGVTGRFFPPPLPRR